MASQGTSVRLAGNNGSFFKRNQFKLSPVQNDGISATSPTPNKDGTPTQDMYIYQNQYKDVSFPKICMPLYGDKNSVARQTGLPINRPDYIADYHFISLMRIIDRMLQHRYTGYISGTYSTPGASKK